MSVPISAKITYVLVRLIPGISSKWSAIWANGAACAAISSSSTVIFLCMLRQASCASTFWSRSPATSAASMSRLGDTDNISDGGAELDARIL